MITELFSFAGYLISLAAIAYLSYLIVSAKGPSSSAKKPDAAVFGQVNESKETEEERKIKDTRAEKEKKKRKEKEAKEEERKSKEKEAEEEQKRIEREAKEEERKRKEKEAEEEQKRIEREAEKENKRKEKEAKEEERKRKEAEEEKKRKEREAEEEKKRKEKEAREEERKRKEKEAEEQKKKKEKEAEEEKKRQAKEANEERERKEREAEEKTRKEEEEAERKRREKKARKREKVAQEVVSSERKYVDSLDKLITTYVQPLKAEAEKDTFIDQKEFSELFQNVEMIFALHQTIVGDMESGANLSELFLRNADFFRMYTQFVSGYDVILACMTRLSSKSKFKNFLENQKQSNGAQDIMSYLIMPVQRIPRYRMLLTELHSNTIAQDNPDYQTLEKALEKVSSIALQINHKKRQHENSSKLMELLTRISKLPPIDKFQLVVPTRRLILDAHLELLQLMRKSKNKTCNFYLFNDILLWTNTKSEYKSYVSLQSASVSVLNGDNNNDDDDTNHDNNHGKNIIRLETKDKVGSAQFYMTFQAKDANECKQWVQAIQASIDELSEIGHSRDRARSKEWQNANMDLIDIVDADIISPDTSPSHSQTTSPAASKTANHSSVDNNNDNNNNIINDDNQPTISHGADGFNNITSMF